MVKHDTNWTDPSGLDYFIAGVPPRVLFEMDCRDLAKLVSASRERRGELNKAAEISFIGLAAYFEAFCKNQFAAIINICPQTLETFTSKRDSVTIELKDILKTYTRLEGRLGSLLSEKYDFGTSRIINSLFTDLLGITPFSTKEAKEYEEFLNDRNLLVHHGGIYTFKYHGQRLADKPISNFVHWNSLVIGKEEFRQSSEFLHSMVDKMATTSHLALVDFMKGKKIRLVKRKREALQYLLWQYSE